MGYCEETNHSSCVRVCKNGVGNSEEKGAISKMTEKRSDVSDNEPQTGEPLLAKRGVGKN